ncbi:2-phospho-L-lactate guanylyltransferase, partial [Micromonospora azadirachtae]
MSQPRWAVVVPAKRLAAAKSRLRGALPGVPHEELALALA